MTLRMDPGAAALLDALHTAGHAAYAVGGCVRDSLLGLAPHDWDLCTSALPQQVMELFGAQQCIPTGLQHGTVTVKHGGALYEITTFRTEGAYTDGRHPDEVHFVPDVREDLARRDFTINAMAYNEAEGLIDPFGGQTDLQSGIVRAVGVPHQRFTEDALRILRLYRFAARFGFGIDPATAQAAEELCAHLDCVSVERIEEELAKLLAAPAPAAYLEPKILGVVLPGLAPEALAAAKPVVDACPAGSEDLPIRLAALLCSLGEDGTCRALKRLRCSNVLIEETAVLVREIMSGVPAAFSSDTKTGCGSQRLRRHSPCILLAAAPASAPCFRRWRRLSPLQAIPSPALLPSATGPHPSGRSSEKLPARPLENFTIYARHLLGKYNLRTVQRIAALGTAMQPERAAEFAVLSQLAAQLDADGVCCRISQLAVNGRDLMAAGIPAGPGIRAALETLLDGVICGRYPNDRQALLAAVQQISAS